MSGTTLTAGEMTDLIKTTTVTNGHGCRAYGLTDTDVVDYFISNTVILTENGAEVLTASTPEGLTIK